MEIKPTITSLNLNSNEESKKQKKIKFKALQENLPQDNELWDYLANKAETGFIKQELGSQKVRFREKMSRWPKTLLLMPPITLSEGSVKRVIPPLGLSYIAGYLESQKIPFEILDCVAEGLDTEQFIGNRTWMYGLTDEAVREYILEFQPEIVGISIIYSSDLHSMLRLAKLIKEVNSKTIVVAGGIHPTIYPREVLDESLVESKITIDYVIRGEGEIRFADFIRNTKEGIIDLKADGLCGWHNEEMFINHQIETINDLDSLPFPAYHRLPMEKYFKFNVPFSPYPRGDRVMQIYASRGCPVGCTFCSSTNFNKAFRSRSPDNVIQEIMELKEKYDIDEIQFADDNLTFDRTHSLEFFEKLKDCKLQWCTPNGTMVNTLNQELLDKMIDSGMYQVTLSLDSGSAKTLKEQHRKPVDLQRVPDLVEYLKQQGILIHVTLVVGMPGESLEEIDQGFNYVDELPIDSIGVFIAQALPGSELMEKAVSDGILDRKKARIIDTAQSTLILSDIPREILEEKVTNYLYEFNSKVKQRDPETWGKKYKKHESRMSTICIGKAAPNTDGPIKASKPTKAFKGT